MQKGNNTARTAHIVANTINVGLFLWQVRPWCEDEHDLMDILVPPVALVLHLLMLFIGSADLHVQTKQDWYASCSFFAQHFNLVGQRTFVG